MNEIKVNVKDENQRLIAILWENETFKVKETRTKKDNKLVSVDLYLNEEYAGTIPCYNGSVDRCEMIYNGDIYIKKEVEK